MRKTINNFQTTSAGKVMQSKLKSNRVKATLGMAAIAITLSACSDDVSGPASPLRTGEFLDTSLVEGLSFETETMSGVTNANGEFMFNAGEDITFSIGNLELPTVQAASVITPLSVFGAADTADTRVVNLSRLLQSLDSDAMADNGLTLPFGEALDDAARANSVDFSSANFDSQAASVLAALDPDAAGAAQATLVDENTASAGLMETLIQNEVIGGGCTADHPRVGSTAEFVDLSFHGVSGTVTVIDDCTIEVTNFNYDGGGINVRFYAGIDNNFIPPAAVLGPQLLGTLWVNDTLRLTLPEGVTHDDLNSLSVWCIPVGATFGNATW